MIEKDIQTLHKIVGPALSRIYSAAILERIKSNPKASIEAKRESMLNSQFDEEEKKGSISEMSSSQRPSDMSIPFSDAFPESADSSKQFTQTTSVESGKAKSPKKKKKKLSDDDSEESESSFSSSSDEEDGASSIKTDSISNETVACKEQTYELVTVLAAFKDDFKNQTKYSQRHIDFLYRIRDRYEDARTEIDHYIDKTKIEASQEFLVNRVIPHAKEIQKLLVDTKLDKEAQLSNFYQLKIDLYDKRKAAAKFFKEVQNLKMPRLWALYLSNISSLKTDMWSNFLGFLSNTMASTFQEFCFESGKKDSDISPFSTALSKILGRVQQVVSFKQYKFNNDDLENVFHNIPQATMLSFNECNLMCIDENFTIRKNINYKLEKLRLVINTKKVSVHQLYSFQII